MVVQQKISRKSRRGLRSSGQLAADVIAAKRARFEALKDKQLSDSSEASDNDDDDEEEEEEEEEEEWKILRPRLGEYVDMESTEAHFGVKQPPLYQRPGVHVTFGVLIKDVEGDYDSDQSDRTALQPQLEGYDIRDVIEMRENLMTDSKYKGLEEAVDVPKGKFRPRDSIKNDKRLEKFRVVFMETMDECSASGYLPESTLFGEEQEEIIFTDRDVTRVMYTFHKGGSRAVHDKKGWLVWKLFEKWGLLDPRGGAEAVKISILMGGSTYQNIHKDPGVFTRLIGVCSEPREVAVSCYRTGEKRDEERGERGEGEGN